MRRSPIAIIGAPLDLGQDRRHGPVRHPRSQF